MADCFKLLHFHLGSQITNIRHIKGALIVAARIYCDLTQRGAGLEYLDVGGGLGVDYDGSQTNFESSVNYTSQEYANDVVYHVQTVCDEVEVPHPQILSESGRAIAAYHSTLVFGVLGVSEQGSEDDLPSTLEEAAEQPLHTLLESDKNLNARNLLESFHDAQQALDMTTMAARFSHLYTADASGSGTFRISPLVPANVSFHVYGLANREAVSRFVAPVISAHPQNTVVSPGVLSTFNVTASGVPLPNYQWRFNGTALNGETNATYVLPVVSVAHAGLYDVIVSNTAGSVTSQVARLTVGDIPIVNANFEVDTFTIFPGYVSGNGPITGWNALDGHGINPGGGSPFADNGAIPNGSQVAFMQQDGALSQTVSGFTVGAQYYVHYYENARGGNVPALEVKVGGNTVVASHVVTSVGANPYREVSSDTFIASATDLELSFIKSNPLGGDNTVLIDNVAILAVQAGTPRLKRIT